MSFFPLLSTPECSPLCRSKPHQRLLHSSRYITAYNYSVISSFLLLKRHTAVLEGPGQPAQYHPQPSSSSSTSPSKCDSGGVTQAQHSNPPTFVSASPAASSLHYQPVQANVSVKTVSIFTELHIMLFIAAWCSNCLSSTSHSFACRP